MKNNQTCLFCCICCKLARKYLFSFAWLLEIAFNLILSCVSNLKWACLKIMVSKVGAKLLCVVAGVVKDSFSAEQRVKHTVICFALRLSFKYNVANSCGSNWLINPF